MGDESAYSTSTYRVFARYKYSTCTVLINTRKVTRNPTPTVALLVRLVRTQYSTFEVPVY